MSSLLMPKVDNAIMSKKDKIASDLRGIINSKNVLSNPDELRPFETDGLTAYRQMPLLVVMPETCLLYTSPSPRDRSLSRMPSSA